MLLNQVIAAVFVVLSSFRTLLSFKGTLYSVCSLSTVEKILIGHICSQVRHDRILLLPRHSLRASENSWRRSGQAIKTLKDIPSVVVQSPDILHLEPPHHSPKCYTPCHCCYCYTFLHHHRHHNIQTSNMAASNGQGAWRG